MAATFGVGDCKHVNEKDGSCKIKKGCGSGSVHCRPIWTDTKCYSLEKPNDTQLQEFGYRIYAYGSTLVCRDENNGNCWQLRPGDYMGKIPKEELIFVKKATLSD
jgi:hypothetical protein